MGNSPRFAFDVITCALLGIGLWAACAGIGYRILPRGRSVRVEGEPAGWRQPGVAACVGLGALLVVGGIAVAVRIPWWLLVAPFLVAGLVLAVGELRGFVARRDEALPRSTLVIGGFAVAAFGFVALSESLVGLRFPTNTCDDLRAYLPMAHRLLDTNALIEPWSLRRLQGIGGFTFLQALPVSVFGDPGIGVAETVIAGIFLAGLFVANGWRSTWARVVAIVVMVAIPLLWVPRVNTTAVLLGSPLLIAALAAAVELRRALRAGERGAAARWAIAGGLVTAAISSARTPLGVVAGAALVVGALAVGGTSWPARARAVGITIGTGLLAVAPWSWALWQAVRTPLYPIIPGNLNLSGPAGEHLPADGVSGLVDQAYRLLSAGPFLWIAIGVLVVAIVARRVVPDAPLLAIAAGVVIAVMVGFALRESWESRLAFVRYVAPMSEALAVFFLCEAIRGADAAVAAAPRRSLSFVAIGAAALLALVGFSGVAITVEFGFFPSGSTLLAQAARNDVLGTIDANTPSGLARVYDRALRKVADPERTILAVDRPYLVDYDRDDLPSLDLPGWTAPDGDFPFFTGPAAKIETLRRQGYDTLVATVPTADACLPPPTAAARLVRKPAPYNRYDRYYLDWTGDVDTIARNAPDAVQRVGSLLVIDLAKAQREL